MPAINGRNVARNNDQSRDDPFKRKKGDKNSHVSFQGGGQLALDLKNQKKKLNERNQKSPFMVDLEDL